jgi:4-amino-4-deoxy-L-arabinose transferase-like glycosyltransferase
MARLFPEFASGIYIYARFLSACLGALTVYLIYRLAKEIYGEKTGIFSAASLSVCMGFAGVNHFAKYIAFVNFLTALAILLCVFSLRSVSGNYSKRYIFCAFFIAGLAASAHFHAAVLLLPLMLTFILTPLSIGRIKELSLCAFIFIAGIFMGTPSLVTNAKDYWPGMWGLYFSQVSGAHTASGIPIFIGPLNYFFEIISIYGFPLFLLIICGLGIRLYRWRQIGKQESVVLLWITAYLFIITVLMEDKFPQTKHVIAAVPFLALYAGRSIAAISGYRRIHKAARILLLAVVFGYSFLYCYKADLWFKQGDPRYEATRWIRENIPAGTKIEVFDQPTYVFSEDIIYDYEIIYLGRSSKGFKGSKFFKWNTVDGAKDYLRGINLRDSTSDYIIVDEPTNGIEYFLNTRSGGFFKDRDDYLKALFTGRKNFREMKVIRPANPMLESKRFKWFFRMQDLWWNPVPDYRATAPTIYIFKRKR